MARVPQPQWGRWQLRQVGSHRRCWHLRAFRSRLSCLQSENTSSPPSPLAGPAMLPGLFLTLFPSLLAAFGPSSNRFSQRHHQLWWWAQACPVCVGTIVERAGISCVQHQAPSLSSQGPSPHTQIFWARSLTVSSFFWGEIYAAR